MQCYPGDAQGRRNDSLAQSKQVNVPAVGLWRLQHRSRRTTLCCCCSLFSTSAVGAVQEESVSSCSRRSLLTAAGATIMTMACVSQPVLAVSQRVNPQLIKAFNEAMAATSLQDKVAAWTRAIQLSPDNAAAWSNRGTVYLQQGNWQAAHDDLQTAMQLEQQQMGQASALVLNTLGNTEGALGRWSDAMQHYQQAVDDAEMGSIALANYALAAFETGDDDLAIKSARQLLRRDPEFLDIRCALTAFLWGSGQRSAAEDNWEQLQQSADGLGAAIYSRGTAVQRVQSRWPPRATAALMAFLNLSDTGQAEGYDLGMHEFNFTPAHK